MQHDIYIYLPIAILTIVIWMSSNVYIQAGCFILLYIICLLSIDFDISHPYVWFIPMFTLYTIGYPLMHQHGYYAILPNCGYVKANANTVFIHWCALCTFIITVSNKQVTYKKTYYYKMNRTLIKGITVMLIGILCIQFLTVLQSGFQTKREILDGLSRNIFFRLGKIANQLLPIFAALFIADPTIRKKQKIVWISSITFISFSEMVIVGERSAFIQILIVELLAYNIVINKVNLKGAFIAAFFLLALIIIGVSLKASFGKNQNFVHLLSEDPLWVKLFNAEFSSASINTTNILNHRNLWSYGFGLKYLLLIFIPFNFKPLSGILKLLGFEGLFAISDNSLWYHDRILTGAKSGYGFSMVADGYMELGILGVIILYVILGLIIKKTYKKSADSMLGLVFYIVLVPIFIYSTRATLLYFTNYVIKYILLPVIMLSVFKVYKKGYLFRE